MVKRLLIDATHNEEVRVAVVSNNSLEEFDSETANKRLTKGNIYLARVIRVEPSLQAAFVEYNNGRHGFLPFAEIHPDYYRIPIADRQNIVESMAMESEAETGIDSDFDFNNSEATEITTSENENNADTNINASSQQAFEGQSEFEINQSETGSIQLDQTITDDLPLVEQHVVLEDVDFVPNSDFSKPLEDELSSETTKVAVKKKSPGRKKTIAESAGFQDKKVSKAVVKKKTKSKKTDIKADDESLSEELHIEPRAVESVGFPEISTTEAIQIDLISVETNAITESTNDKLSRESMTEELAPVQSESGPTLEESVENEQEQEFESEIGGEDTIGEDDVDTDTSAEINEKRNLRYRYKIQEVIKRRQIMLVQVVKEERGNKGASLTSYLSLPGRYCVLMPNSGHRIGGVSRKISDNDDRRRLRSLMKEFEIPEGMSLIVRTAGQERNKSEIKRDYEYLLRVWDEIREKTMTSSAPELVYAEGDLIKRAIRDIYDRDVEEVLIEGEESYKVAKNFMKSLIPSHAKKVKLYKDPLQPIFHRFSVEEQIEKMHQPVVNLPSGGSIVINHTEALVAIDVNSGKSTRERNIDDTALKTNLEAAAEIGRQLRLRDIGGIVVIDFIDMHDNANIASVERKVRDALKSDRARIQVGRISQFGLLELSRQRLRPSILESHSILCTHCHGTGLVRSVDSLALQTLREIERIVISGTSYEILVTVPAGVDLFLLNQKRNALVAIEERYGVSIHITNSIDMISPNFTIEVLSERPRTLKIISDSGLKLSETDDLENTEEDDSDDELANTSEAEKEDPALAARRKSRRNNNRRRRNNRRAMQDGAENQSDDTSENASDAPSANVSETSEVHNTNEDGNRRPRHNHAPRQRPDMANAEHVDSTPLVSESPPSDLSDESTSPDADKTQERRHKTARGRRHPYQRRQHNKGPHNSTEPNSIEKKIFEPKVAEPRILDGQIAPDAFSTSTKRPAELDKISRQPNENRKVDSVDGIAGNPSLKKKDEPKKSKNWLRRFLDS